MIHLVAARWAIVIYGLSGDDRLFGRGGGDTINGGSGSDSLFGEAGNDILSGGGGRDVFVFSAGLDMLLDFDPNVDQLQLDEGIWGGGLTVEQVISKYGMVDGSDVSFSFSANTSLQILDWNDLSDLNHSIELV